MTDPRTTPLHERHERLGASFTDFGGWLMPVRYTSDLAEHHAVRTAAGLFDISHMAEFRVTGSVAGEYLDYAFAGRLSALAEDQAKYTLLLDVSGGIVDDVIVYRLGEEEFLVVANAGNRAAVAAAMEERAEAFDVRVDDITEDLALIAVQGPAARAVLDATISIDGWTSSLDDLRYYRMTHATFRAPSGSDVSLDVARTGYTGEDGFELFVPVAAAGALWDALSDAGSALGLVPAGLAARDTLRLEAGMPLYGNELTLGRLPAQADLGRVVALDKEEFVGGAALSSVVEAGAPVLVGLTSEGRRAGRAGYSVLDGDRVVGEVTSGALSPTLGYPIAMAYVAPSSSEPGTELALDVRGTRIPATVIPLPFYRRKK